MVRYSEWDSTARTAPQQGLRLKWSCTCNNARYNYAVATVRFCWCLWYISLLGVVCSTRARLPASTPTCSQPQEAEEQHHSSRSLPFHHTAFRLYSCYSEIYGLLRQWGVFGHNASFSPETTSAGFPALRIAMRGNRPRTSLAQPDSFLYCATPRYCAMEERVRLRDTSQGQPPAIQS